MKRSEIIERQKRLAEWRGTEIGRLFERYDCAIGHAWAVDQTSNSANRMNDAWEKADAAKREFLDKVCEATGVAHPYAL